MGVPELDGPQTEVSTYADVGLFGDGAAPDLMTAVDVDLIRVSTTTPVRSSGRQR